MLEARNVLIDIADGMDKHYVKNYVKDIKDKIILIEGRNGQRGYLNLIPRTIEFDEFVSYNLGLWIGDRWGGKSRVGLKNKDIALISSFKVFLRDKLYQDNINEVIIRRDNRVDIGAQLDWVRSANMSPRVVEDPSMFGNWVYGIFVQNGSLRTKVMDRLVKELPDILQRSSEEVVAAFISGVIDAEAYMDCNKRRVAISVSLRKKTGTSELNVYLWCLKRLGVQYFLIEDRFSQVIKMPYKGIGRLMELVEPYLKSLHKKNILHSWT